MYESNRRGGVWGGSEFFDPPPKIYWATPTKFLIYYWIPQLKPSRLLPFLSELGKRGVCVHVQKSKGTSAPVQAAG